MEQITDTQLEERARELADLEYPSMLDCEEENGYRLATIDRLRDARESLKWLEAWVMVGGAPPGVCSYIDHLNSLLNSK